jgi:hypothetical protein
MPPAYRFNTPTCYTYKGFGMGSKGAVTSHKHSSDKRVITACTKTLWRHSKFRICVTQTRNPLMQPFPFAKFLDNYATTERKKEVWPPYIGQLAMTFKKHQKMQDGQIAYYLRPSDQMMDYFTDTHLSQWTLNVRQTTLSSRTFKNELQHMLAFVPLTQYLTHPRLCTVAVTKKQCLF